MAAWRELVRITRRNGVAALAVVGAALAAIGATTAGCGTSSTVDPVAQAATVTGQTHGAQLAGTFTFTLPAGGQTLTMPASGVFDFSGKRGKIVLDMSRLSALAGGRVAFGTIEERVVYPTIYMRAAFLTKALPGHQQWVKIDLAQASKRLTGVNLSQLTTQSTPGDQLQQLRASGNAHRVGTDTIRGVATTHYRATVDLHKLPGRVPPSQRQAVQQGVNRLVSLTGTSTYPVDVWIDAQHHVRRQSMSMSLKLPTTGQRMSFSVNMEFFNFGVKPAITAPPANQVFDATGSIPSQ
jgi:hypothetical protein